MNGVSSDVFPRARIQRAIWALGASTAGCCVINALQYLLSGRVRMTFLYWNLALAWIPLLLALLAWRLHRGAGVRRGAVALCGVAWFLFFPNAPYIVTDFVHLPITTWRALWYLDLLILLSFAWTGVCLGYLSLHMMQEIVRQRHGRGAGWGFAVGVLGFSSFGIYLGRFSRWNSWDVVRNPVGLVADSVRSVAQPAALAFSATIFLFLLISYGALLAVSHLPAQSDQPPQ